MGAVAASSLGRLGPYELLHKLATGGMSEIYEARRAGPHGFSKRIALKRILPQLSADPELVAMFVGEAKLCAQLSHPNLVQVFDFGEEQGELYMAMELVLGTTCAKLLRSVATRNETVPVGLALYIGLSLARGLEHAHEACDEQGIPLRLVHRDVSPGNVLISRSGAVKLSDFGIARAAFLERRTEHGQLKGKLGYMSPEQVLGRELDEKADQFSAAIVIAEMLIGRPLFGGGRDIDILVRIRDADISNLARFGTHIPEEVRAMLLRALQRRADDRFPTTRSFVEAIEDVMRRAGLAVRPAALAAYLELLDLAGPACRASDPPPDALSTSRSGPSLARTEPCDPPQPRRYSPVPAPLLRALEPLRQDGPAIAAEYRILLPSGELGPLTLTEMAKLFATGVLNRETLIQRDDSSFQPASLFRELERLCSFAAFRWDEAPSEAARESFDIVRSEWPGRLFDLMQERRTGLLFASHDQRRAKCFLVDGLLESTASSEPRELLGSLLISAGLAKREDIERAVAIALQHGGRMGDALVALGILRSAALGRALIMQTRRRFIDLCGWPAGEASFVPGARSYEEDVMMPDLVPPMDLVAQGIREGYSAEELSEILAPRLDAEIAPALRPRVGLGSFRLSRAEAAVIEKIDGSHRIGELVEACVRGDVATREEAHRAVFIGLSVRLLSLC